MHHRLGLDRKIVAARAIISTPRLRPTVLPRHDVVRFTSGATDDAIWPKQIYEPTLNRLIIPEIGNKALNLISPSFPESLVTS